MKDPTTIEKLADGHFLEEDVRKLIALMTEPRKMSFTERRLNIVSDFAGLIEASSWQWRLFDTEGRDIALLGPLGGIGHECAFNIDTLVDLSQRIVKRGPKRLPIAREPSEEQNSWREPPLVDLFFSRGGGSIVASINRCSRTGVYSAWQFLGNEGVFFGIRERALLGLLAAEVWWLHVEAIELRDDSDKSQVKLSPRLFQLFQLLLGDLRRKDLAVAMELSPHTIDSYVKEIYRTLGVSGRRDLAFRYARGDLPRVGR